MRNIRLTGNMTGRTYQSDGPTLTILFKTDLTGQRDGFYVRWNAVKSEFINTVYIQSK